MGNAPLNSEVIKVLSRPLPPSHIPGESKIAFFSPITAGVHTDFVHYISEPLLLRTESLGSTATSLLLYL